MVRGKLLVRSASYMRVMYESSSSYRSLHIERIKECVLYFEV